MGFYYLIASNMAYSKSRANHICWTRPAATAVLVAIRTDTTVADYRVGADCRDDNNYKLPQQTGTTMMTTVSTSAATGAKVAKNSGGKSELDNQGAQVSPDQAGKVAESTAKRFPTPTTASADSDWRLQRTTATGVRKTNELELLLRRWHHLRWNSVWASRAEMRRRRTRMVAMLTMMIDVNNGDDDGDIDDADDDDDYDNGS